MITKQELDETITRMIMLAERIKAWQDEDQGQLAVGCYYANLHIIGLASTLGAMQGILDQPSRTSSTPRVDDAVVLRSSASKRIWGITVATDAETIDIVELDPQTGAPLQP